MTKGLERKEEFQKVKMAAFLRDLHKLAKEDQKKRIVEFTNSREDLLAMQQAIRSNKRSKADGTLTLTNEELKNLPPVKALHILDALHSGERFTSECLMRIAKAAVSHFQTEDTVVDIRKKRPKLKTLTVVGDIHGSLSCLLSVIDLIRIRQLHEDEEETRAVVFDGDFVDRGKHSLEVLMTAVLLKLSHKDNVFVLRGNHEDTMTASTYGFLEEIEDKYGQQTGDEIWYEFGYLFASFPICARTNKAVVLHGGIPSADFSLAKVNKVAASTRCSIKTTADPYDDDEELLQGILWSDPAEEDGIEQSERGAGFMFGPDIAREFLQREGLQYLIRAHEPFEEGTYTHDVGDGKAVITIFSTANYPFGEGTNNGAVLFLNEQTGEYKTPNFIHKDLGEISHKDHAKAVLSQFVEGSRSQLARAFGEKQDRKGYVSVKVWVSVMASTLELPDIPWLELQPDLAPTDPGTNNIDWREFIKHFTSRPTAMDDLEQDQLSLLQKHKDKFLNIFELMDSDGNGTLDKDEFVSGIKMLSEQIGQSLPGNPKDLFKVFDVNGDGEISINEFCKALEESAELKHVTESIDTQTMDALQKNNEMLVMAFKYLDTDKSGAIDRDEFQRGIDLLNKRLSGSGRVKIDPNELFDLLDADGNGEIDVKEFNQMFRHI